MELNNCHSCMMPLTPETKRENSNYCTFCSNPDGTLLPKEQVQIGIAQFLSSVDPTLEQQTAQKRAEYFMKAMPAWADR